MRAGSGKGRAAFGACRASCQPCAVVVAVLTVAAAEQLVGVTASNPGGSQSGTGDSLAVFLRRRSEIGFPVLGDEFWPCAHGSPPDELVFPSLRIPSPVGHLFKINLLEEVQALLIVAPHKGLLVGNEDK